MSEWITTIVAEWGALGVAFLMLIENVFPPVPSEVVLPLAGAEAAQGELSLATAVLAATAGALVGALPYYLAGRWVGCDRLKRWAHRYGRAITLTPQEIDDVDAWFDRHGQYAVLFGRLVPGVRTLISIPAGLSGMTLRRFLTFSAIGTFLWSLVLIGAGYALGQDAARVEHVMAPVGNVVLWGALLYYLYRVATFRRSA